MHVIGEIFGRPLPSESFECCSTSITISLLLCLFAEDTHNAYNDNAIMWVYM